MSADQSLLAAAPHWHVYWKGDRWHVPQGGESDSLWLWQETNPHELNNCRAAAPALKDHTHRAHPMLARQSNTNGAKQWHIDVYSSEGARTELIISPILREVYKKYAEILAFWVQKPISADPLLAGVPDYIFGHKPPLGIKVLGLPLVLIVEAKKNDFDQGWGQCLAELVAAQKINNTPEKPVFGIVTDAIRWEFGKLTANVFIQDEGNYFTDEIAELFGAIDFVLKSSL